MTDKQLIAIRAVVLCSKGRVMTEEVHRKISDAITELLNVRAAYRECGGHHKSWCNSHMGWGLDCPCDCPRRELDDALGEETV